MNDNQGQLQHETAFVSSPTSDSTYLNVSEMAELLRKTPGAIYAMTARGQLPGVTRIGRRLLFQRRAVLDWLDRKTAPSPQERQRA